MHSLLIVDDEVYIANKTKDSVNWEELGITEVFVAYNIRQAKEIFEEHRIDMMICDIEMPQGNGIELLAWVREHYPKTESIFLTCHAEFEYTKKAIQLGSLDYLLKPVMPDELRAVVWSGIEKINKARPSLIQQFWQDLIHQTIPSNAERIQEIIEEQNLPYPKGMRFLPILIGVQHWEKWLSVREENILEYALRKCAEELILANGRRGNVIQVKKGCLLTVIPVEDDLLAEGNDKLKEVCQSYIEACARYFYCQLSCYVGEDVFIHDMVGMFDALDALHRDNVAHGGKVFFYNSNIISNENIPLPQMNIWSEMLKRGDHQNLLAETNRFLEEWKQAERLDARKLGQFYQAFLQMLLYSLQENGLSADQILSEHLSPDRVVTAARSIGNLQAWVQDMLETVFLHLRNDGSNESMVDKIRHYITRNIDQALSRQYIADYIGLSPDYMVKMFKKETGISISDYIVRERIEMAKELLAKSDLPVSSIALAVGYTNFAYFSTTFKKEVSITPHDYRKRNKPT